MHGQEFTACRTCRIVAASVGVLGFTVSGSAQAMKDKSKGAVQPQTSGGLAGSFLRPAIGFSFQVLFDCHFLVRICRILLRQAIAQY